MDFTLNHPNKSLLPALNNQEIDREAIYWEHEGNRAIRKGKWKLVSEAKRKPRYWDTVNVFPIDQWELYDLEKDRSELNDLSDENPALVKELASSWQSWADRVGVTPKPR